MPGMGELERAVMDQLWTTSESQTVRQVHEALTDRGLAYTTVMTVLQRLAKKELVTQERDERAHRYAASQPREALVAGLMVDALSQTDDRGRQAALVSFVQQVSPQEAAALRAALGALET